MNLTKPDPATALIEATVNTLQSPHSRRAYRRALVAFTAWYTAHELHQLTRTVVTAYKSDLESQGKSAGVINQHLCAIRKLVSEAAHQGQLDQATAAGIMAIKGIARIVTPAGRDLKPSEITALLVACDSSPKGIRDAAILSLLYGTGARRMSVVKLDLADYDPESLQVIFRAAKQQKDIETYVPEGTGAALDDWLTIRGSDSGPMFYPVHKGGRLIHRRLSTQAIWHIVKDRAAGANLTEKVSPHDLRRTFVGDMIDAGADPLIVSRMVGHSNIQTTLRYDRRPGRAKAKAAARLHVPYFGKALTANLR